MRRCRKHKLSLYLQAIWCSLHIWGVKTMKLKNVLIVVKDIERSRRFYDPDGNLIEVGTPM